MVMQVYIHGDMPSSDPYRADIGQYDIPEKHHRHLGVEVRDVQKEPKRSAP
jgi:hypothetical protein